jgi:hypothetical protein
MKEVASSSKRKNEKMTKRNKNKTYRRNREEKSLKHSLRRKFGFY